MSQEKPPFPADYPHGVTSAGKRINKSPSWLRKKRMTDSARIAEGKAPEGPVWAVDATGGCFYYEADLQDWLRRSVVRVVDEAPAYKRPSPHPNAAA